MIYLQVGSYSASFNSKGALLNWLAHQGVYPSEAMLENGDGPITIYHKDGKVISSLRIVEFGTQDNDLIEEFFRKL